jgi:V8-like Glu-specific endopeptidase
VGVRGGPIVNGQTETGYNMVGALTDWEGNQYYGAFCTGTLIAPTWVLTAAHCVEDMTAGRTRFFVGANANNPNSGTFYKAARLIPHEQYNANSLSNDIALVQLQTSVVGVTPMAFNQTNLRPYQGQNAFFIGYGATEGVNESGSGVKRSVNAPISNVYNDVFVSNFSPNNTGTCLGDSGGPSLLTINGTQYVIGVTSAGEACNGANCDPCRTPTTATRVDYQATWISGKLNLAPPDCRTNAALCSCADACQADGTCNDAVCATSTCDEAYTCLVDCSDQACVDACFAAATPDAQTQLNALLVCLDDKCSTATTDTAFQQCAESQCGNEVGACFGTGPVGTGTDSCEAVYNCLVDCSDNTCATACYSDGTAEAQTQIDAMLTCLDTNCANATTDTAYQQCAQQYCANEITACFSGPPCTITGGSCDTGAACYPTQDGSTGCFSSAGKPVGQSCNADATSLECVDGAACLAEENASTGICQRFCTSNAGCGAGKFCDFTVFGVNTFGVCDVTPSACTDADNDGACSDVDCNDNSAAVRPGLTEACGNSIDDNCNGQTDEGCSSCVDADEDGFCANAGDCNDNDPTISPSGSERCGDGADNNCNSQTDEGCTTCVDTDKDGYCADVDCNDASATVHPSVAETCGNGVDDNCNGQTDEGCSTTPTTPGSTGARSGGGCAGGMDASWLALVLGGLGLVARRRVRA